MFYSDDHRSCHATQSTAPQAQKRRLSQGAFASCLFLVLILLGMANTALASHYRGGSITWNRTSTSTNTVTFTVTQSWRSSAFSSPSPTLGGLVSSGFALDFGDGSGTTPITLTVNAINGPDDNFTGTFVVTHTYASAANYTAFYSGSARLGAPLVNNAGGSFRSESYVNLATTNLSSPISTLPVIVNVPVGQSAYTFNVPAVDPEGTALTYALSTNAEYLGSTACLGLSINSTTGVATINTTLGQSVNQLYNGAFTIREVGSASTMVDFLIKIVNNSNPPIFDYATTPANGTVYSITPGQNISFGIRATDPDAGDHVSFNAAGVPSGATFSPTMPTTAANPALTNFSWTPGNTQFGSFLISFIATDDAGIQSTSTVTINVNANPVFIAPTPAANVTRVFIAGTPVTDVIAAESPNPTLNTKISAVTGLPAGATLSPAVPTTFAGTASTTMSWTPTASNWGPHTVTFTATDDNGNSTNYSYILAANSIPVFTSSPVTAAVTCQPYTYTIRYADADAAYGDTLLYEHSTLPAWLNFTDNHDGTGVLSGTPTAAEAGQAFIVSFTAADYYHHISAAVVQNFTIAVSAETTPPTFTAPSPVVINGWCGAGIPAAQVSLGTVSGVSDNCTTTQAPTNNAPSVFPVGNTTVTWTVKDAFNNVATRTQLVTVNPATVTSTSVVSVPYTVSGQEIQSIYLNYPMGAPANQTQTITVGATGGTNSYSYAWEKSTANNATLTPVNGNTTNSYTFAPSLSDISGNDDNIFTFKATITDTHGCVSTQTKKINVVNPWVSGGNAQICHKVAVRGGSVSQLMIVPQAQLAVHLGHYDGLGNCPTFNGNKSEPAPMAPAQEVAVYPNPSTGMFVLEISYVTEPADIIVTDIQGRVVSTQKVAPTDEVSVSTIDLTGLAKGMYLVLVKEGDFRYQTKLVVR